MLDTVDISKKWYLKRQISTLSMFAWRPCAMCRVVEIIELSTETYFALVGRVDGII